jgi:hypothetical protein
MPAVTSGMAPDDVVPTFVPVFQAAAILGVPRRWLEAEAKAGRIPRLKAGSRTLVNVAEVERVLHERAREREQEGRS